jgi:hypothetical protein
MFVGDCLHISGIILRSVFLKFAQAVSRPVPLGPTLNTFTVPDSHKKLAHDFQNRKRRCHALKLVRSLAVFSSAGLLA